jgi:hypothetical protein
MAEVRLFSASPSGLCIAKQNSRPTAILRWRCGPPRCSGCWPVPPTVSVIATKAAMGAAEPAKDLPMTDHDDSEPPHAASATDLVLNELQLFGYRPFDEQPDPRPLPEGKMIAGAIADIFDALVATMNDTRLEPDLPDLLWSTVNLFHRAADRIHRQLDDNEQAQRKSQREQNGSEVRSVELERLTAKGITLIERRNCLELLLWMS